MPDLEGKHPPLQIDMTVEECRKYYPQSHRIAATQGQPMSLEVNIELGLNQKPPVYAKRFGGSML